MSTVAEGAVDEAVPAEDVPDGTFGHARNRLPDHMTPCTLEEQARHFADLDRAVARFDVGAAIRRHCPARPQTRGDRDGE